MTYEAITLDGQILDNSGRGYVSRAAARAAADRRGLCPTETRPLGERVPSNSDAAGWDDYRRKNPLPAWTKAARESGCLRARLQASAGRPGHRDLTEQLRMSRRLALKQKGKGKNPSKGVTIRSTGYSSARYGPCEVCRKPCSDVHILSGPGKWTAYGHEECLRRPDAEERSRAFMQGKRENPASKKAKAKYHALVSAGDYAGAARTMRRIHAGLKGSRKNPPKALTWYNTSALGKYPRIVALEGGYVITDYTRGKGPGATATLSWTDRSGRYQVEHLPTVAAAKRRAAEIRGGRS